MNTDILRQWRYYGATEDIRSFGVTKDQFLAGKIIGFIAVADALPKPPGHVANPYSFPFPVRYSLAEGIRAGETHSDDEVIAALRKTAVQLERDGVRVISTTYGPFARFQRDVADAVSVPVYLSPLIQIPWIRVCLKKSERIAILCDDRLRVTHELLEACHVSFSDFERIALHDVWDIPVLAKAKEDGNRYDYTQVQEAVAAHAKSLREQNPDIGAILFECLRLPSFARDIQAATNLPVYDAVTMLKYVAKGCMRRQFEGFV